jgi:CheY-like chemotaxis protein
METFGDREHFAPPRQVSSIPEIVIVDSACDRYGNFVEAAQEGRIHLHFCVDGGSAVRLARRFRADAWLISTELPDISGFDALDLLAPLVLQSSVDPLLGGSRISLDRMEERVPRSAIFMVTEAYRMEEEQRALACGVSGYLVRPVVIDGIVSSHDSATDCEFEFTACTRSSDERVTDFPRSPS